MGAFTDVATIGDGHGGGMARRTLAALTVALLLGVASMPDALADRRRLPPPDAAALQASIAGLPDEAVTSAQVRVAGSDGRWTGREGVRDVRTGLRVPADAELRIGSVTKAFTAAVVMQLVAEHRLRLEDPVQRWLPGVLPRSYPDVTIRQLLDHTSGLPMSTEDVGHEDPAWVVRHRFDWHSPAAVVRSATRQPMAFLPGTSQQYNGVNYFLAGMVVEKATGHAFADELRTRLLRPLRLAHTYLPERGKSGSVPGFRTLAVTTVDAGRSLTLSLTTTGNGDGSESPRLMRVALAAFRSDG